MAKPAWIVLLACITSAGICISQGVTNSDAAALGTAIARGDNVTLAFDGTVKLLETLLVATNTTVDATGHKVVLDGGNLVRHFRVTNGATLRLVNVQLANGRFTGTQGQTNEDGGSGWGGSIYGIGARLELVNCAFISNQVVGGKGGSFPLLPIYPNMPPSHPTFGGSAYGGAICMIQGSISMTNCMLVGNRCTGGDGTIGANGEVDGGGGGAFGGALYGTNSSLWIKSVIFSNNVAHAGLPALARSELGSGPAQGGAVYESGPDAVVGGSVFAGNQVLGGIRAAMPAQDEGTAGGGAYFHQAGVVSFDDTLFAQNFATGGSAGSLAVDALTIFPEGSGGAVYTQSGRVQIQNSTFLSNRAKGGTTRGHPG